MDPLSATVSAITILDLSIKVYKAVRRYQKGIKNAPSEIKHLLDELEVFQDVLVHLRDLAVKAETSNVMSNGNLASYSTPLPNVRKMIQPDAALNRCFIAMQRFMDAITRHQSSIKKALRWPFQKEEVQQTIDRLQHLRALLEVAIAADNVELQMRTQASVDSVKESLEKTRLEALQNQIVKWLDPPDPTGNYNSAREKQHPGTGQWLLRDPSFELWKSSQNTMLWVNGKPGCGKSILSSTAINYMCESPNLDTIVAYFYFDFQRNEQQTADGCLRWLIKQLAQQHDGLHASLEDLYKSCSDGQARPPKQSLMVVLKELLMALGSVHIVIDAADECNEHPRLLQMLKEIHIWKVSSLHILVTSRREKDIQDALSPISSGQIMLEESVIAPDIQDFIHFQVYSSESTLSQLPSDVCADIETTLVRGADGMFRWVVCQLDELQHCLKPGQIRSALRRLPETLDDTYARIIAKIPKQHSEDARRILQCLTASFYPLDQKEVAEVVAIDVEHHPMVDPDNKLYDPQHVLIICSSLVTVVPSKRVVRGIRWCDDDFSFKELRLAHYSVKEYLISNRVDHALIPESFMDERASHEVMASYCIRYLLYYGQFDSRDSLTGGCHKLPKEAPFAPYAAMFWARHFKASSPAPSSPVYRDALILVREPKDVINILKWQRPWWDWEFHTRYEKCKDINAISPLYYASMINLANLIPALIDLGEPVDSVGPRGTALCAASFDGHKTVAKALLLAGADIDYMPPEPKEPRSTPLISAVKGLQQSLVELLLKEGADADLACGYVPETPIQKAAHYGRIDIVRLLIDAGADVNRKGARDTHTALQSACISQDEDMVSFLLSAGAEKNDEPYSIGNALCCALHRSMPIAKLLLRSGVDVNAVMSPYGWGSYGTAIQFAASNGEKAGVEMLLEYGAEPDCSAVRGSALHVAKKMLNDPKQDTGSSTRRVHLEEVIDTLLAHGAHDIPPDDPSVQPTVGIVSHSNA